MKLKVAGADNVLDLVALRNATSRYLTERYGKGNWSGQVTERGVLFEMRISTVYVARIRRRLIATLALSTRKPWAIDKKYFKGSQRPLYLTSMAVEPGEQRKASAGSVSKKSAGSARNGRATRSGWMPTTPKPERASSTGSADSARWDEHRTDMFR